MKHILIIIICAIAAGTAVFYAHHRSVMSEMTAGIQARTAEADRLAFDVAVAKKRIAERNSSLITHNSELSRVVRAICLIESDNHANRRGRAGERGIMQLRYNEWRQGCKLLGVHWSWNEAFEKSKNIAVGTAYLNMLTKKYKSWETAVKVYHCGHHGVFDHGRGQHYLDMVRKAMATGNTKWRHK